jgi:hypothetical protein
MNPNAAAGAPLVVFVDIARPRADDQGSRRPAAVRRSGWARAQR